MGDGDDRWSHLSAEMSDLRPRDGAGMCPVQKVRGCCTACRGTGVQAMRQAAGWRAGGILSGLRKAQACVLPGESRVCVSGKYPGQSMYRFKYANRREYAAYYAREAAALYQDWVFKNQIEVIVPVPMYRWKKRRRGYNQAETFARALGRELGLPWTPGLCAVCGTRCRRRS